DPEFEPKMAEILCVYRQVAMLRGQTESGESQGEDSGGSLAIVSYDEKPGIQAIATTAGSPTPAWQKPDCDARSRIRAPRHPDPDGRDRSPHRSRPCPGQGTPPQPRIHRVP